MSGAIVAPIDLKPWPNARERVLALAHVMEPLMILAVDAEQAMPPSAKTIIDGLLRMRWQLTRYQVWLLEQAKRGTP